MQTTPKPISTKSPRKTKNAARFLLDWAAVIALALCFIVFTLIKGSRFMSFNNMINILRAMSITTVFAIAATVTMAPDGFDMSACTLASCSAYVFVSMYLWVSGISAVARFPPACARPQAHSPRASSWSPLSAPSAKSLG